MVAFAEKRYGALHVLFNNAGIFPDEDGSVVRHRRGGLRSRHRGEPQGRLLRLQVRDPALLRAGGGSVINTASFVAVMGGGDLAERLHRSKGGVLALTREIAVEFAARASAPTRSAGPGQHTAPAGPARRPAAAPAASSICRWAASRRPRDRQRRLFLASDESRT
jgi:NAD(P)-dependent dehydrogenase (short-subunit alcohol dehydrogenase family)